MGRGTITTTTAPPSSCYLEDKAQKGAAYFRAEACGHNASTCEFNDERAARDFCNEHSSCVGVEKAAHPGSVNGISTIFTRWAPMMGPLEPRFPTASSMGSPAAVTLAPAGPWTFFVKTACGSVPTGPPAATTQAPPSFCYLEDKAQKGAAYFRAEACRHNSSTCEFNDFRAAQDFCNEHSSCVGVEKAAHPGSVNGLSTIFTSWAPMMGPLEPRWPTASTMGSKAAVTLAPAGPWTFFVKTVCASVPNGPPAATT